jgi:hypothetical protein
MIKGYRRERPTHPYIRGRRRKLFLRMRRTQASGGSNSTADGTALSGDCDYDLSDGVVVAAMLATAVVVSTASVNLGNSFRCIIASVGSEGAHGKDFRVLCSCSV